MPNSSTSQMKRCFRKPSSSMPSPTICQGPNTHMRVNTGTFDYIIKKHDVTDAAVRQMAVIIRGADTDRFNLAPQAAGLWAISAGLSYNYENDNEMLQIGMKIYDALFSWAKFVQDEKHVWTK